MNNENAIKKAIVLPCGKCSSQYTCGECIHMDLSRKYGSKYYCRASRKLEDPDNSAATYCRDFVERYG